MIPTDADMRAQEAFDAWAQRGHLASEPPNSPLRIRVRRRIRQIIRRHFGKAEWTSYHYRVSSAMMNAWLDGVHEDKLEQWMVKHYGISQVPLDQA
jgi:hypothetical protein